MSPKGTCKDCSVRPWGRSARTGYHGSNNRSGFGSAKNCPDHRAPKSRFCPCTCTWKGSHQGSYEGDRGLTGACPHYDHLPQHRTVFFDARPGPLLRASGLIGWEGGGAVRRSTRRLPTSRWGKITVLKKGQLASPMREVNFLRDQLEE